MTRFVIAVEYDGADLPAGTGGRRRAILEHAYEVESGALAHGPDQVRVGFASPERGWQARPTRRRCADCAWAVDSLVAHVIGEVVQNLHPNSNPGERCDLLTCVVSNEDKTFSCFLHDQTSDAIRRKTHDHNE